MKKPSPFWLRWASCGLLLLSIATYGPALAQAPKTAPMHVHHVHLNSVNPAAAAAYYPKPFAATATKTTFNGYEAVKTGNLYLLFTKVAMPPQNELTGPQTSVWHFGWNTPDSRKLQRAVPRDGARDRADVGRRGRQARGHVERHAAGAPDAGTDPRDARARASQPTRQGGFGYLRGPDGVDDRERAGRRRRALQSHSHVPRASALRDAVA